MNKTIAWRALLALLMSGALLQACFAWLHWDIETHTPVLWAWTGLSALLVGLGTGRYARRMAVAEVFTAAAAAWLLALAWVVLQGKAQAADVGIASPQLRALFAAPVALGLCSYAGLSGGYLLWGSGGPEGVEAPGYYERWVGRRLLLSKSSPVLSTVTTISVVGVALGVWLVLVALAVLSGFERDLETKIIGAGGHLSVTPKGASGFVGDASLFDAIAKTPGVAAWAPVVRGEVAVASRSNYTGGLMYGVEPEAGRQVLQLMDTLEAGGWEAVSAEGRQGAGAQSGGKAAKVQRSSKQQQPAIANLTTFVPPAKLPHVVLGIEMAKLLNVTVGDRVRLISPTLETLTPVGVAPKSLGFRVAGIFTSGMYEYDARYLYVSLPAARRFLELPADQVSEVLVRADSPATADRVGVAMAARLAKADGGQSHGKVGSGTAGAGPRFSVQDWKQRNQTLFASLKLERVVAFVVLVFIILVASFAIVNTLTMSVLEKRKEIAILKTMGARDVGIMKIFLTQGLLVGGFGTLMGALMAVATVTLLQRFGFWIPGEVYYIDSLPVHLEGRDVLLVTLAALLIVWDFAVFPSLRGSRLQPVEGLRDG